MKAHERTDYAESTVSNELFWGVIAVVLTGLSIVLGWFGFGVWGLV